MNSNVKSHKRRILAYAAALWLACGLAASNAEAGEERSETVKFADLDLGTSAGVQALYGRIHAAAWRVCWQPDELEAARACTRKTESNAIGKVNVPSLTALYQKKTGSSPPTLTASR